MTSEISGLIKIDLLGLGMLSLLREAFTLYGAASRATMHGYRPPSRAISNCTRSPPATRDV